MLYSVSLIIEHHQGERKKSCPGYDFNRLHCLCRSTWPSREHALLSDLWRVFPQQMLQKLLASKNPDDLRAANRLIREMVRRVSPPLYNNTPLHLESSI